MNQKTMFAAFTVLLAALIYVWGDNGLAPPAAAPQSGIAIAEDGDSRIAAAYRDQISGLIVETSGVVARVLPDDNQGSRHQRFILRLRSGQTLLVSHNIDLAPRSEALRSDDTVELRGEYERNHQGGVIHWTHHDPQGRHAGGWIRHQGRVYECALASGASRATIVTGPNRSARRAMSDRYLVISALGKDRPGIVNTLSKSVLDSGCNVSHSRMAVLGGEFALILLIHGNEEAVAAMQRQLPALEERLQLTRIAKTTAPRHSEQRWLPYRVRVVAMDHPGIVHRITDFFSAQKINIEELETAPCAAPHPGAPLFALTMPIAVPAGTAGGRLRETFIEFCDGLNLDASLEAVRD